MTYKEQFFHDFVILGLPQKEIEEMWQLGQEEVVRIEDVKTNTIKEHIRRSFYMKNNLIFTADERKIQFLNDVNKRNDRLGKLDV